MFKLIIQLLPAFVITACITASKQSVMPVDPLPPVQPMIKLEFRRGGLNIMARFDAVRDSTSLHQRFIFSIDTLRALLRIEGRAHFDTLLHLPLINGTTGLREKIDSISVESFDRWSNPLGLPLDRVRLCLELTTLDRKRYAITFDTTFALPADSTPPFISVKPSIDARTDSAITFALLARRHRGFGEDYYPTSERFRLEIFDEKGILRFSSNHQMNFLQVISPVEPKYPDELKRYTFEWSGIDNDGNPLPPGRYTAVLSLVTKPYPYTSPIEFEWNGLNP